MPDPEAKKGAVTEGAQFGPVGASGPKEPRGVVFATTGECYTILARRAARTLRAVMPDIPVDLFTDQTIDDPVFSQIHRLEDNWFRPKMTALLRSRFRDTLILDADVVVLTDVSELFEMVGPADIAAALGISRGRMMMEAPPDVPRCAPLYNTGVMVVRMSPQVRRLVTDWQQDVRDRKLKRDQGSFRRMLWRRKLQVLPIPHEYNVKHIAYLDLWNELMGAPRILHSDRLHEQAPATLSNR